MARRVFFGVHHSRAGNDNLIHGHDFSSAVRERIAIEPEMRKFGTAANFAAAPKELCRRPVVGRRRLSLMP
jgi:hypothetical protein